MSYFVDLSHAVEHGVITYPGLPAPIVCDFLSREHSRERHGPGTEFQIGRIDMVGNTGTHVDAPFHRFAEGIDLAELPLESLAEFDALVVDSDPGRREVDASSFEPLDVAGRAVLVRTGWSRHYATARNSDGHPFVTASAARLLRDRGARFVGIDSMNVDDTADPERPVHTLFVGAGIPVCEHLTNLGALPARGFRFSAVLPRVRAFGTFPVRAYARLED